MKSFIICPGCRSRQREDTVHCTKCDRLIANATVWRFDELKVSEDADLVQLVIFVYPSVDVGQVDQSTIDRVMTAFDTLEEHEQQVVIRRAGLDGRAKRSWRLVGYECRVSTYMARDTGHHAAIKMVLRSRKITAA